MLGNLRGRERESAREGRSERQGDLIAVYRLAKASGYEHGHRRRMGEVREGRAFGRVEKDKEKISGHI